jgi:tRNA U34 5-methylaminomethyl-2-thiouridine-forming methyltransferase MnmC
MHNQTEFQLSGDGGNTLKTDLFNTYYHSVHGVYEEADVVFIQSGLDYFVQINPDKLTVNILEMGFGTGLNALKTLIWSIKNPHITIHYYTIEAYPLDFETASKLNYTEHLGQGSAFKKMHECPWNLPQELIAGNFYFTKYNGLIEELHLPSGIDIVYYDAFAPSCQPHLWLAPVLTKIHNVMNDGGVLTTYCAQGEFRRQLLSSGFKPERIPGPNRKREITRALKI